MLSLMASNLLCLFTVTVEGCLYEHNGTFKLHCEDHQYIDMQYARLGRSAQHCRNNRTCCPLTNICENFADSNLNGQQWESCNGKQQCEITVLRSNCSKSSESYDTDYELATYHCYNNSMGKFLLNCSYFIYPLEKYGNSRMV